MLTEPLEMPQVPRSLPVDLERHPEREHERPDWERDESARAEQGFAAARAEQGFAEAHRGPFVRRSVHPLQAEEHGAVFHRGT